MEKKIQLGECHAHMVLDGVYYKAALERHREGPQEDTIRKVLRAYQKAGITYVRDGGDACGVAARAARLAGEYGIEYRMPLFAMHREGRYGHMVGKAFRDLREYRQLVDRVKRNGGDFIKVMVSGILDFSEYGRMSCPSLENEEIREIVNIAHGEGMAIMLHINGTRPILAAIEAGADSLEHGFYMSAECCQALAEHRETVWVPTLAPVGNQIGCGRYPDDVLREILFRQQRNVRRVVQAGGRVALGSDAGAYLVPHAQGVTDELGYLTEALKTTMEPTAIQIMLKENEDWIRTRFCRS